MYLFKVLLIISSMNLISSEDCGSLETCSQCIGSTLRCVWCPDEKYAGPRCVSREKLNIKSWCMAPDNPVKEDEILSNKDAPLKPSHVHVKARPGDTFSFNISYKPELDYPIDIYYLFDNSATMETYKKDLQEQAQKIYDIFNKTTNNIQFGVGSFVEKLGLPYASTIHNDKLNTFNNHLSLTKNISQFVEAVSRVNHTSNLDDPEAGLDALMQAMVCWNEIGWRNDSRRIIILSTDETYHSAGDGRAVGAFIPNDMQCHLTPTEDGISTHKYELEASLTYDYPSVSQINFIAKKYDIHIFFVATKKFEKEYKALEKAVYGSMYSELVVKNATETSVLANTIAEQYRALTQSLQISHSEVPAHLDLELNPKCEQINDDQCKIPYDGPKNVTATIRVKNCPKDNQYSNNLTITASGTDKLTINIEVLCQCDCEKHGMVENSTKCSINGISHGTYQCGLCKCDKDWYGKTCQCHGSSTEARDLRACKVHETDDPCSGRGSCSCGKCKCGVGYDGEQCQYKLNDCVEEDKICSDNGICKNNLCECNTGWKGRYCSCSKATNFCVGANTQICSGNGDCECNHSCKCFKGSKYSGKYCDQCDTCVEERCEQLKDYVICYYKTGKKQTCAKKIELKNNIEIQVKNQTEIEDWSEGNECNKVLEDESVIVYKYLDGNNLTTIWVQSELKSPPERNIWIPIGSSVGAIILIGIITLIAWMVLVNIYDAREYRKYAKEAEKSGYEVMKNPLYKPAIVNVNNPAYTST